MEVSIEILKKTTKKNWYETPVFYVFFMVLVLVFSVLSKIIGGVYDFIKHTLFRRKRKLNLKDSAIILKTEKYHLTQDLIEETHTDFKIAQDFYEAVVDYDDNPDVYTIKSHNYATEIDNCNITYFKHECKDFIYLQKVRKGFDEKPTSDLIKLNTTNGKVTVLAEIGLFELSDFDEDLNAITGFNLETEEDIIVRIHE